MASSANSTTAPSRRQFFSSAVGAGIAAAAPPIFVVAGASTLAQACDDAIGHIAWMDERVGAERWSDERFSDEMAKSEAVFTRAINEPSKDLSDLLAKARLGLDDRRRFCPDEDVLDQGEQLSIVVLREIIALLSVS